MFYKQRFIGLSPGQQVRIRYQIEFASNLPDTCEEQSEPVFLKAGASNVEPRAILQEKSQEQILQNTYIFNSIRSTAYKSIFLDKIRHLIQHNF